MRAPSLVRRLRSPLLLSLAVAACQPSTPAPGDDLTMELDMARPVDAMPVGDLKSLPPIVTATCGDWTQSNHDEAHSGVLCATGQTLTRRLDDVVFDPFVAQERAEAGGSVSAHYQVPLVIGDDIYMEFKTGKYVSCNPPGSGKPAPCGPYALDTQIWNEKRLHWNGVALEEIWTFTSDWKPAPLSTWEAVFQPAAVGDVLYIPGAGGTLFRVGRAAGEQRARLNPFGTTIDPSTYVTSGVTSNSVGDVYYTATHIDTTAAPSTAESWLVRVAPSGVVTKVSFQTLLPGAPAATDQCVQTYSSDTPRPWPPTAVADGGVPAPVSGLCGAQRAALNATPAVGADGTIFVVSTAHLNSRYSYVVAVKPDLTPRWATSLRGLLHDGCGVLVPSDDDVKHCSIGATLGVDPETGDQPAAQANDFSTSSPVALPGGGVLYGAVTFYNGYRGHLLKLDLDGKFQGSYDFGWDTTPAVRVHDGTYSIITKDNHYLPDISETFRFFITQLRADLSIEWRFANTNTKSCQRDSQGQIVCVDDKPNGFEWCVNSIAVDQTGVVYANAEDGNAYAIRPDGTERERLFLDLALGAAYTPIAVGRGGLVYTLNDGHLTAVGK